MAVSFETYRSDAKNCQREDITIREQVQQRLASGSYGRLNPKRETGVLHFHELYRRAMRESAEHA